MIETLFPLTIPQSILVKETYAVWPDGYVCPKAELTETLLEKSDDYILIEADSEQEALDIAETEGYL